MYMLTHHLLILFNINNFSLRARIDLTDLKMKTIDIKGMRVYNYVVGINNTFALYHFRNLDIRRAKDIAAKRIQRCEA